MSAVLLERARREARLTQEALARKANTSRPTLSAYEHGRKSPSLETTARLLAAAGFSLEIVPRIRWSKVVGARGQVHHVPDRLFRLPLSDGFARFEAPLHLEWSSSNRTVDLADRRQRTRWYEVVLREGGMKDIQRYVDGALLIDTWPEIVVPKVIRSYWQAAIDRSLGSVHD